MHLPTVTGGDVGWAGGSLSLAWAVVSSARERGIPIGHALPAGSGDGPDWVDGLLRLARDPHVNTLAACADTLPDEARLLELAREAAAGKPTILLVPGENAGAGGISWEDGLRRLGFIPVSDVGDLLDALMIFSRRPGLPRGRRVGIVTTSGASGILMADHCQEHALAVPALPEAYRERLAAVLPSYASFRNPVDTTAMVMNDAGLLRRTAEVVLDCPQVDMVAIMFSFMTGELARRLAAEVSELVAAADKPVVVNVLGGDDLTREGLAIFRRSRVPYFRSPGRAAAALARLAAYGEWTAHMAAEPPGWHRRGDPALRHPGSADVADGSPEGAVRTLLRQAGVPLDDAAATGPGQPSGKASPYPTGEPGDDDAVHAVCWARRDPAFGPVVAFGADGVAAEVFGDRSYRLAPVTPNEAREMIGEVRSSRRLRGYRGRQEADVDALVGLLVSLSEVITRVSPRVTEIRLDPVVVRPRGEGVLCRGVHVTSAP